jgi:hypothetical protein
MTTKPVAREGDVSATVGSTKPLGVADGTWQKGQVSLTTKATVKSDEKAIVVGASCTFTMPDAKAQNGSAVTVQPSTVTLIPGSAKLNIGGSAPLLDGDSAEDMYGNKVSVTSDASWSTA